MLLLLAGDKVASTHFKANSIIAPLLAPAGQLCALVSKVTSWLQISVGCWAIGFAAGYRSAVRPANNRHYISYDPFY